MQLEIKNNSAEMYKQYQNGTPVSEISKITGIKPKAIYKRFERMHNDMNIVDNVDTTVDNVDTTVDNVDTTVDNVEILASIGIVLASLGKDALILMLLVGLGLLVYWAYRGWVQNKS